MPNPPPDEQPLNEKLALTPAEVAALTGVTARKVCQLTRDGLLPRIPHTRQILVSRTAVDAWLAGAA